MNQPSGQHGIFFAGTDTDVGKTYCATQWLKMRRQQGYRVGAYKPVASGCEVDPQTGERISGDAIELWNAAGRPGRLDDVCPQRYLAAASPPVAAAAESRSIEESMLETGLWPWLDSPFEEVVIEGAGGLFSPLSTSMLNIDLVRRLRTVLAKLPLILVAADRLGVQHQVIATCRAASASCCPVDAVWLNRINSRVQTTDESLVHQTNADELRRFLDMPIVSNVTEMFAVIEDRDRVFAERF